MPYLPSTRMHCIYQNIVVEHVFFSDSQVDIILRFIFYRLKIVIFYRLKIEKEKEREHVEDRLSQFPETTVVSAERRSDPSPTVS